MPFPDYLYYAAKQENVVYGFEPEGQLDVNQLIKSKPYWRKLKFDEQLKKKTLIVADVRRAHWGLSQKAKLSQLFNELIDAGFTLYFWSNSFLPVNKQVLQRMDTMNPSDESVLIFPDELRKQALQKLGLPAEQIHILDDSVLDLLSGAADQAYKRGLKLSHYSLNTSKAKFLRILTQAQPPIDALVLDTFSEQVLKDLVEVRAVLPALPVIPAYEQLMLKSAWGDTLLNSGRITEREWEFRVENLRALRKIKLSEDSSAQTLQELLIHTPELQVLDVSNAKLLSYNFNKNIVLACLKILLAKDSSISSYNLNKLLSKAKTLQRLQLMDCPNLIEDFSQELDLPELVVLTLMRVAITSASLKNLLGKTPKLHRLALISCTNVVEDFTPGVDLPFLAVLAVDDSPISGQDLSKFLLKTPNLQQLSLVNCRNLADDFIPASELSVRDLFLSGSSLSSQGLKKLLAKTPKLYRLHLLSCANLHEEFSLERDLPTLEILRLSGSSISGQNLKRLLEKTPKLSHLDLSSCAHLHEAFSLERDLSALETLDLSDSSISGQNLKELLAKTPKLKSLNLSNCKNVLDDFSEGLDLSFIDTVILSNSSMSSENLKKLLAKTPKLKILHLANCPALRDDFIPAAGLPFLEQLSLSQVPISSENMKKMLVTATRLQQFRLVFCPNLHEDFTPDMELPCLKHFIYQGKSAAANLPVRKLLSKAVNLKLLDLEQCQPISEHLFQDLKLSALESLTLNTCSIAGAPLRQMLQAMPHLKTLDLLNTQFVINQNFFQSLCTRILVKVTNKDSSLVTSFAQVPAVLPPPPHLVAAAHNPERYALMKPTPANFQFEYQGTNKSFNQQMLIEKLSQYFTLTGQHKAFIPKMQNGICTALAYVFVEQPLGEWLPVLAHWDGSADSLQQNRQLLEPIFTVLITYLKKYQLQLADPVKRTYLGDNLAAFLAAEDCPASMVFTNSWHAIAVKYDAGRQQCMVYDPNFVEGPKACSKEQLLGALQHYLGKLISVHGAYAGYEPNISAPAEFIRNGGLLALCLNEQKDKMLAQLRQVNPLPIAACKGLLLRFTSGMPVWVKMLQTPVFSAYALELLATFIAAYPQNYTEHLQGSVDALSPSTFPNYLTCIANIAGAEPTLREQLANVFRTLYFEHALQTWQKLQALAVPPFIYYQQLIQGAKKQLLEFNDEASVHALQLQLEQHCHRVARPIFYVDSPDDLICSAPSLKNVRGTGVLQPGPGGRLYDFLLAQQQANAAPIILVNYANFAADDIVRFNQLLDTPAKADGIPLPAAAQIIGLINTKKPSVYQGEDFYSRFDKIISNPLSTAELLKELKPLPIITAAAAQPRAVINLYQAPDWRERLLGKWLLQKDKFVFVDGELSRALTTGLPIAIHNGLWDKPKFSQFWQQAYSRGYIDSEGGRLIISPSLQLIKQQSYDWASLVAQVSFVAESRATQALNPGQLSEFFQTYHCDNAQKTLETLPGLVAQYAHKDLPVYLTRSLDEHQWAMLLAACQQHHIKLLCCCAPGLTLPQALHALRPEPKPAVFLPADIFMGKAATQVIESKDSDATITMLTKDARDWQIINISECSASDLLMKLEATPTKLNFEFKQTAQALLIALEKQQKIILVGTFSTDLSDALAPLLLKRQQAQAHAGQLILVSSVTSNFSYLPRQKHEVEVSTKRALLATWFTQDELNALAAAHFEPQSISQLRARLNYKRMYPEGKDTRNAWQGLFRLAGTIELNDFNAANSAEIARAFNQQRLDALNRVLLHAPYVFLTGLSGVGKSTFVEKNLQDANNTLYQGESHLLEWAQDQSTKRKILFIDEANLSPRQWSEFEGLFSAPPGMLISGRFYPLTATHKVVFAGNPLNYGDARQLAAFFRKHGNALVFAPMPAEFIYEAILKPVLAHRKLAADSLRLCQPVLAIYRFICECAQDKVLISPRELQMMLLLVMSYAQQRRATANELELAVQHYAYQLGNDLVPEAHRETFTSRFKPEAALPRKAQTSLSKPRQNFLITPSRAAISQQLEDLLALRQFKREQAVNEMQAYGGIHGIIIEGEPGVGKSEMVLATLLAQGYQEEHAYQGKSSKRQSVNPFYRLPVSMPAEEKKALLLKAFNEGAVVVIDEINSSPMMERLLNDLLMGYTAEKKRPHKPGFLIIGTQNPVTMSGRHAPSTALARRLLKTTLATYTMDEMQDILIAKGLEPRNVVVLVSAYEKNVKKAQQENLTPAPTFRDLLKFAEQVLQSQQRAPLAQAAAASSGAISGVKAPTPAKAKRTRDELISEEKEDSQPVATKPEAAAAKRVKGKQVAEMSMSNQAAAAKPAVLATAKRSREEPPAPAAMSSQVVVEKSDTSVVKRAKGEQAAERGLSNQAAAAQSLASSAAAAAAAPTAAIHAMEIDEANEGAGASQASRSSMLAAGTFFVAQGNKKPASMPMPANPRQRPT